MPRQAKWLISSPAMVVQGLGNKNLKPRACCLLPTLVALQVGVPTPVRWGRRVGMLGSEPPTPA